jgi:putative transposase
MPRQPRLDTPGALHHIMGRGIDGKEIFAHKKDCEDFLSRLKDLCEKEALNIYARALMDTHFHLLARDENGRLKNMSNLLSKGLRRVAGRSWLEGVLFGVLEDGRRFFQ